jgi:hypothetical protein
MPPMSSASSQAVFGGMTTEENWHDSRASGIIDALAGIRQGLELGVGIAEIRIRGVWAMLPGGAVPTSAAI